MADRHCGSCGALLIPTDRFCGVCGAEVPSGVISRQRRRWGWWLLGAVGATGAVVVAAVALSGGGSGGDVSVAVSAEKGGVVGPASLFEQGGTVNPQSQSTIASGTSSSDTAAGTPEPAAGTPEPAAGTPEPAAGTPEPAAADLSHTAVLGYWTEPNSSVVVRIGVGNRGQVTAPAATIEIGFPDDRFPDGLQVTAVTVDGELVFPGSGCTTGSRPGVLRCALGDIAGGDLVQLEIEVFVADVWPGYYDGVSMIEAANYGPIDFGPFPRIVVCGGEILCQP